MTKEFAFINLFRATAAFWVLSAHCMIWGGWYGLPVPSAKIAVDLFMMISGYLMAANAFSRSHFEPLTTSKNWLRFWLRRFFRLAPAYYLSLALAVTSSNYFLVGYHELQSLNPSVWPAGGTYDPTRVEYTLVNIALHLSFLFGLHPTYSFSTFLPDWSLSLEIQFYFVFPALLLVMQKFGFRKVAIYLAVPSFIIGYGISRSVHYLEPSLIFMKLNYFIAGILMYRILLRIDPSRSKRDQLALALCAVVLVSLDIRYGRQTIILPFLLCSMLILGWLEVTKRTPRAISYVMHCRLTKFASDTSYCVYLFHGFFISIAGLAISSRPELLALQPCNRVLFLFFFVASAAYLTAYFVHRLIEVPGIHLGKYIIETLVPIKDRQEQTQETNSVGI